MKISLRYLLLVIVVVVLAGALVMAKTMVTEFSGTETMTGPPSGGTVICPQGQLTGQFPFGPPCTSGAVHVRGVAFPYVEQATDRRMTGTSIVVANANWDGWTAYGPGSGPMWGTVQLRVDGGLWEGAWTGERTVTSDGATSNIHAIIFGTEGSVKGLKAEWNIVSTPESPVGNFTGRIMEHTNGRGCTKDGWDRDDHER